MQTTEVKYPIPPINAVTYGPHRTIYLKFEVQVIGVMISDSVVGGHGPCQIS